MKVISSSGAETRMEPSATPCFSAVMMADVSGYSSLSSMLAERGANGAEILRNVMKGYLDKIIERVLAHSGDIVKFAGDAIIVYWKLKPDQPESEQSKGELVLRTAYCCMDLLSNLGTYEINIPGCPFSILRIHLGIGAGQVYDVHVGGDSGRWEHFIAGDAIRQLSTVLDLAKAGELAMSHTALKSLANVIDIDTINIGDYDKRCIIIHGLERAKRKFTKAESALSLTPEPAPTQNCIDNCKHYINDSALFKLQADISQSKLFRIESNLSNLLSLHELRQVTTVFIRLGPGLQKWDSKDSLEQAQQIMTTVQKALKKYEGSLRQFHVDDKGAVILAFFGLPPLAHLNDANHGIKAVLEIHAEFSTFLEQFSIGITTGVVSIGGVGNNSRTEYAVMGDSINMAARLMCHPEAENSILCDEKTFNLCEADFVFQHLGEAYVKGKSKPINIFRPLQIERSSRKRWAISKKVKLIGRTQEKKVINDVLNSFEDETGAGIGIFEGEGGQGLTSLVNFIKERCAEVGVSVCSGEASEMENLTPFYSFKSVLTDIINIVEDAEIQENGTLKLVARAPNNEADSNGESTDEEPPPILSEAIHYPAAVHSAVSTLKAKSRRSSFALPSFQGLTFSNLNESSPTSRTSILAKSNGDTSSPLNDKRRMSFYKDKDAAPTPTSSTGPTSPPPTPAPSNPALPVASTIPFRSRTVSHYNRIINSPTTPQDSPTKVAADASVSSSEGKISIPVPTAGSIPCISKTAAAGEALTIEAKLKRVLMKLNEPPEMLELFNVIMSPDNNASDAAKQPMTKIQMKESVEVFCRIVNSVSSKGKFVIIINETQWVDPFSWELLWEVVNTCPRTAVFIFARSERSYEAECGMHLRKFKRLRRTTTVKVQGLDYNETIQMMIATWQGKAIKGVSSSIADNIFKRSNGNPLYIRSLMFALKESGQWRIDDAGLLAPLSADINLENLMLGYDLHSIIVAQFDRLDHNFQLLLKVASILGQKFSMDDVVYFLSDMPGFSDRYGSCDKSKVASNVEEVDKFGYLQKDAGDTDGVGFHFKSAVVRRCISHMMVDNQRQHLHLNIAKYYESKLTPANRHRLLIPIYEHYSETDRANQSKKMFYLEEVAHYYYQNHSTNETIKHYNLLLQYMEEYVAEHAVALYPDIKLAQFYRELGEAYSSAGKLDEAKKNLYKSLAYLHEPFPDSQFSLKVKTRKEWSLRKKYDVPGEADESSTLPFKDTVWGEVEANLPSDLKNRMQHQDPKYTRTISSVKLVRAASRRTSTKRGSNQDHQPPPAKRWSAEPPKSSDLKEHRLSAPTEKIAAEQDPTHGSNVSLAPISMSPPYSQEQIEETEQEQNLMANQPKYIKAFHLKQTLIVLAETLIETEEYAACEYASLKGLNLCELFPRNSLYARYLATMGYIVWIRKGKRALALKYLDAADQSDTRSDLGNSAQILFHTAQTLFLMGVWDEAMHRLDLVQQLNYVSGDTKKRDEAMKLKTLILYYTGPQSLSEKTARALCGLTNHEDDMDGRFWGCCMSLASLLSTVNCIEELQETRETLKSLWDTSTPPKTKLSVPAQITYLSLLADCDYRLGLGPTPTHIWMELSRLFKTTHKHHWLAAVGCFHALSALHAAWSSSEGLKAPQRKAASVFLDSAIDSMKKMEGGCSLVAPMRSLAKGVRALLQGKTTLAVQKWKRGLEHRDIEGILYLKATLHDKISRYTEVHEDVNVHAAEARKLFRKIGAQYSLRSDW
ncbi:hypothetical protein HDV05_006400 [Chytridiales sp. JEL 0842]|nr:hypothetical protein HDV05_006400 [Chytridiales sp. JEL 0842]